MPDNTALSTSAKIASIILLLVNYGLTVNAAPLGGAEMTVSRFYWILLAVVLAVLALIYIFSQNKSPITVQGLVYDKTTHKLELTVKNNGDERYCIRSALRLIQPAQELIDSVAADGKIPMASASAQVGGRRMFQLLAEDDAPVVLDSKESKTLSYDVLMPADCIKLDDSRNVEVHIAYGEDEGDSVSRSVSEREKADSFCLKLDSGEVVAEAFLIEDLLEAIKKSPEDGINFHEHKGSDLAVWVRNVVGDLDLASQIEAVAYTNPQETKQHIIKLLDSKVESLKHPYLRKVNSQNKFVLKAGHDRVLGEIALLEDLAETLVNAPTDVVAFHLRSGNDFAEWIQHSVGDAELAHNVRGIKAADSEQSRNQIVSAIRARVDSLKC
jgi:hypothetical protein